MKTGDVVRFDYTLIVDGKPVDTSMAQVASDKGILRENRSYTPLTITLGRQQIIPGLEDELLKMKVGANATVEIAAERAYGNRDPKKVSSVPMAQFRKEKVQPRVGMELNMQGQRAVVTRVGGGRVTVDMNHDLAGKDLTYEIDVREVVTDPKEKMNVVIEGLFPGMDAKLDVTDDQIDLEVPDQAKFSRDWPTQKFRVITEIRAAAGNKPIRLIESYPAFPEDDEEE